MNEIQQAIYQVLLNSSLLSYEGWLYRRDQLPEALAGYEYNYVYVRRDDSKTLYYITAEGTAEAISDASFDFDALEQDLQHLEPDSSEIPDIWALSHEQFQQLITKKNGPAPRNTPLANPVMTAEVGYTDAESLLNLKSALLHFNILFGDLAPELKQQLVTQIITTNQDKNYQDAFASMESLFRNEKTITTKIELVREEERARQLEQSTRPKNQLDIPSMEKASTDDSMPMFSRLPQPIKQRILTTLCASAHSTVALFMNDLFLEGFLDEGNTIWPYLAKVLEQSPNIERYVTAAKMLNDPNNLLFTWLKKITVDNEPVYDWPAFLDPLSTQQQIFCLRLAQHLLHQGDNVSDEQLQKAFKVKPFLQHVAYGQQDEADALLKKDHTLAQELLTARKIPFTDYSGRTFKCSAYEYAYWAKDTHMCRMLERHMDNATKQELLNRVRKIEELTGSELIQKPRGLAYRDKNGVEHRSAHFDLGPLKRALRDYLEAFDKSPKNSDEDWAALRTIWLKVGLPQREVPAHIAQEYCHPDRSFYEVCVYPRLLDAANPNNLKRTLYFFNKKTVSYNLWFTPDSYSDDAGLGSSVAIVSPDCSYQERAENPVCCAEWEDVKHNLWVIGFLDEARTKDLIQSRANLESSSSVQATPSLGR
ncbi:hypothetical protein J2N86_16060 (plasmid) [Legionella lytica]|uniref:SidC N-terminal domain-containing protein n=1 Tax=Legionella lytica TaxID=96232 RepID=A0ABY4YER6_9GAMM|nr:hypothetical protein [Legionella lytica]USQ15539.1 hypothetical protein J2N86_16060 [Legionella lytica]